MLIRPEEVVREQMFPGASRLHYIDRKTGAGGLSMGILTLEPQRFASAYSSGRRYDDRFGRKWRIGIGGRRIPCKQRNGTDCARKYSPLHSE